MRSSLSFLCFLGVAIGAGGVLANKAKGPKKSPEPKPPVAVQVKNACEKAVSFSLSGIDFKGVAPGALTAKTEVRPEENGAYRIIFPGAKTELPYLFFIPGGSYTVELSNCRGEAADLRSMDLSDRPTELSPQAAAKVRFRASRGDGPIPNLEYRSGARGSFKRLSLGMTSYQEISGGEFQYALRLRGKRRGRAKPPVMKNLKSQIKLEPGHKYLIEAQVVPGSEIIVKIEDEGWAK